MKKILLLLVTYFQVLICNGQFDFNEGAGTPFDRVNDGSIAFADVDGDGDQDVLITGYNASETTSKLYLNDGEGSFSEYKDTPFKGVVNSSIAFADVDGDGDQDVLITGQNSSGPTSKLYLNDGNGNFTEDLDAPFDDVLESSIDFGDFDGDGDQDVLITGSSVSIPQTNLIAKLYSNDGNGNYTEVTDVPFEGVQRGTVDFIDLDNDGDLDVFITGVNSSGDPISKSYTNDGTGIYTLVADTPFEGVQRSSVAFADIEGDGDQDILISGQNENSEKIINLFINDGGNNYTEQTGTPFDAIINGSIGFIDVDNDGNQDVLITGNDGGRVAKLYSNDGNGTFTEVAETPFVAVKFSSHGFADVNGDGNMDILVTGDDGSYNSISAKLYINDGVGDFSDVTAFNDFEGVMDGSVAFGDIDEDGDEDLLITGNAGEFMTNNIPITKLYTNDGSGNFSEVIDSPIDSVANSSVAFEDVDGDGDLDLFISGINSSGLISKLYINDGVGNFSESTDSQFKGVEFGSIAFTDIDGDGDEDLLITGDKTTSRSYLYNNDGSGVFTQVLTQIEGVTESSIAFADIDGDGDQDVLITGLNDNNIRVAKLYSNDGTGNFTEVSDTPFEGVDWGSVDFADIDNDGDQDLLITGRSTTNTSKSKLYINDGNGNFTEVADTPFEGVGFSSHCFVDIDNDGFKDVILTGSNSSAFITKLYINNGGGNFSELTETPFFDLWAGTTNFADVNGDGNQDLFLTGDAQDADLLSKLYLNTTCLSKSTDTITACDSHTWIDGLTYTESNYTATDTLTDVAGCDSIVKLNLTINSNTGIDTVFACDADSYTWIDGISYTESNNTATHTLTNIAGCDSVVTLNLTITESTTNLLTETACDSYTWLQNGETYTESGIYKDSLGCHLEELDLTIFENTVDSITVTTCGSYYWMQNGTTYTESGLYLDSSECHVEKLDLTINEYTINSVSVTECESYYWSQNGLTYTESGIYTDSSECHIEELNLTITESTINTEPVTSCESYTWPQNDVTYTESGIYIDSIDCHVEELDLTITGLTVNTESVTSCDSYTWSQNGETYFESGIYRDSSDCLVEELVLNINHSTNNVTTEVACGSYTWPVNNETYLESGTYIVDLTNQAGCDSVFILDLTMDCSLYANLNVTNSDGESCNGTAEANAYGGMPPYAYLYSNDETTPFIEDLCEGVYDLTITDSIDNNYQTTFVISDKTINYDNDPNYHDYEDSLFGSAIEECDFDYNEPIDSFYVDIDSIIFIDENLIQVPWSLYQNGYIFTFTVLYYITEDIIGDFAYTLSIYCEGENKNNTSIMSANFIYKTKNITSLEKHVKDKIKIYPNPTNGAFRLEVPTDLIGQSVVLTNSAGQVIQSDVISNSTMYYSISTKAKGIYFIKLQTPEGTVSKKLIRN